MFKNNCNNNIIIENLTIKLRKDDFFTPFTQNIINSLFNSYFVTT